MTRRFCYVPIEALKARYTKQLRDWVTNAYTRSATAKWTWTCIEPPSVSDKIQIGSVLDSTSRGVVSFNQMQQLLELQLTSSDAVYLQDLWTPGVEALLYQWSQRSERPLVYAMCHAQSVDEYDFTYKMRSWMRGIELSYMNVLHGLFVASTIHRDQLRAAGVSCPIHVVGLPFDRDEVWSQIGPSEHSYNGKQQLVVYTSRLNNEKNPHFMLDVAEAFLDCSVNWAWAITTSADQFSSEVPGVLERITSLKIKQPKRFIAAAGLTKRQYYQTLRNATIQFNSSLQDYVSWTLLEALTFYCIPCYPEFRSFPECVDDPMYRPFDMNSAVNLLLKFTTEPVFGPPPRALAICRRGLDVEMNIMLRDWTGPEVNVWHQPESYFRAVGLLP